jgi:P27 family predicted phage terminase small subunit
MTTTSKTPSPPKGLSAEAGATWKRLHKEFNLADSGAVEVLHAGLRAFDQMREAEAILKREGLTVLDRYNVPKMHPAFAIAKTARGQWFTALRMLGLHREGIEDDATGTV